jgi:hypothetical protein
VAILKWYFAVYGEYANWQNLSPETQEILTLKPFTEHDRMGKKNRLALLSLYVLLQPYYMLLKTVSITYFAW